MGSDHDKELSLAAGYLDFLGTDTHNMKHLNHLEKIGTPKIMKLIKPLMANNNLLK